MCRAEVVAALRRHGENDRDWTILASDKDLVELAESGGNPAMSSGLHTGGSASERPTRGGDCGAAGGACWNYVRMSSYTTSLY